MDGADGAGPAGLPRNDADQRGVTGGTPRGLPHTSEAEDEDEEEEEDAGLWTEACLMPPSSPAARDR